MRNGYAPKITPSIENIILSISNEVCCNELNESKKKDSHSGLSQLSKRKRKKIKSDTGIVTFSGITTKGHFYLENPLPT